MNYPNVLFLRYDKYKAVDTILEENKPALLFSYTIVNDIQSVCKLFDSNYHILVTYGDTEQEYHTLERLITTRINARWLHYKNINDINDVNYLINYCYINNVTKPRRETRVTFSIFTTTFNSYSKLLRAYESIKQQELKDWEWVIVDDSTDESHFTFLKDLFKNDYKVRLYRRKCNSGLIGEVKNEAVSLCRGRYLLELDHDDTITPDLLSRAVKVFEDDEEIGFVYTDFINIHENGDNFKFGDFICKGYGGYYTMKMNNKWVYVYITPNVNNVTLSHIVCVPNHPRIWKREVIHAIGNYSEFLPICDDLELLLRTAIHTKMAKICQVSYVQYMNEGGNNFTWIRNKEICRLGPMIIDHFNKKYNVDEEMKKRDAYEDNIYKDQHSKIWKRTDYTNKYCNKVYNFDYDKQYCILGIDSLINNTEKITDLYKNIRNDFILVDNTVSIETLWQILDENNFHRMKCYSFHDGETKEELKNYFNLLYKSCADAEILE